jgi:hypothetical protein
MPPYMKRISAGPGTDIYKVTFEPTTAESVCAEDCRVYAVKSDSDK